MKPSLNDSESAAKGSLAVSAPSRSLGCMPTLALFTSALVLSCFSATFYYRAAKRPVWQALLFFVTLMALASTTLAVRLTLTLNPVRAEVAKAFRAGDLPQLTVSQGQLSVHGSEPFVRDLGYGLIVIDTTGAYDDSDLGPGRYDVSILFTRNEWLSYEDGQITRLAYSDILGSGLFEFKSETILHWLDASVLLFFLTCAPTWTLGCPTYIVLAGLVIWGIATLVWHGTTFNQVLIGALYAAVPALYTLALSSGLPWMLLIIVPWLVHGGIWIFGLVCMLWPRAPGTMSAILGPRSLRAWRVLIALPFLIMLCFPSPFFGEATSLNLARWLVAAFTMAVLIGLSVPAILRQISLDRAAPARSFPALPTQ